MKILFRLVAAIVFAFLFIFALKNTQEVALQFFLGQEVRGPLVLVLLSFFIGGAVLGILAFTPTLFRYRRELAKQKKALMAIQTEQDDKRAVQLRPPQPDTVSTHSRI